jgi:chaperone required for assembly of F1-ATPase
LATAIAAEWDAQTDEKKGIEPVTMPLMTLASTAIDQILPDPTIARENCLKYLPTDSALFFTDEQDRILLSKQRKLLSPVVRWVGKEMKTEISMSAEMAKIRHKPTTIEAFENFLRNMVSIAHLIRVVKSLFLMLLQGSFHFGMYAGSNSRMQVNNFSDRFHEEVSQFLSPTISRY